ncbi:MAG: hypothetical protein Q7S12_01915 [bacterium]|nr:hypothetical protein [bacterium]
MIDERKIEFLISPGKFFPANLRRGSLLANSSFIAATSEYLAILSESQYWPREYLDKVQVARFQKLAQNITKRSPFWADHFKKNGVSPYTASLSDISRLPILRRQTLLELGTDIHVAPEPEDHPIFRRSSSGTTGIKFQHVYSEKEMIIGHLLQITFRHPVFENISFAELFSRKPFVVLGTPGFRYVYEKDFFYKSFPLIKSENLADREIRKEIYKSIHEAAPAVLVGFGSLIAKLAEFALEDRVELPLLAIRTSSEPISIPDRNIIKQAFGVPVINMLSGNGIGGVGFECPLNDNKFHVHSENIILEIAGDSGELMPDGKEGELVATSLSYTINPIIHYAHNDSGLIIPEACPCGRTLPLFEFNGRRGYDVILPSGKRIRMMHLHKTFSGTALGNMSKQLQIIQNRPDNLRILIVPKRPFTGAEEIGIRSAFANLFGNEKINIEIQYSSTILPGRGNKPCLFIPLSEFEARKLK